MKKIVKERDIKICFEAPFNDLNNLKSYLLFILASYW